MSSSAPERRVRILRALARVRLGFDELRSPLALFFGLYAAAYFRDILSAFYPIEQWLFWDVATLWLQGLVLSLACVSTGLFVLTRLRIHTTLFVSLALAMPTGLIAFTLLMYLGGFLALYSPAFAFVLPAAMFLLGARPLFRRLRHHAESRTRPPRRNLTSTAVAVVVALFGLVGVITVYLQAFTPDAVNFDASWCHLTVAQDYAREGRIVPFIGDYARNHPHLASIVHTWGWLLPNRIEPLRWMFALHTEFFIFLWTLVGIAAATKVMLAELGVRSTWAAYFLFPSIFVYDHNLGGAADHFMAFFTPALLIAVIRAWQSLAVRDLVLVAIFGAGALLTKYQAAYILFPIAVLLALRIVFVLLWPFVARKASLEHRTVPLVHIGKGLGAALLVFGLLVLPHFGKNWAFYGNPVYPWMQDTFASHPTVDNAAFLVDNLFRDWHWVPKGTLAEKLADSWELSKYYSFESHYSFAKRVPKLGSAFTLCLPLLLLIRRSKRIWVGALIGWSAIFMWAMTFRVDRNLQTFVPILAATTAAIAVRAWQLGWLARGGIAAIVLLQAIWGGDAMVYEGHKRIRSAMSLIRSGYANKRTPEQRYRYRERYLAIGEALPPEAVVLLHNGRTNLGINRPIIMDWPGQQGAISYAAARGPRDLWEIYRALGITHLLHRPGSQRSSETKQGEVLFIEFFEHYAQSPRKFGSFEIAAVPSEPPPELPPRKVLALGIGGYGDGLYAIEHMNTYERAQPKNRRYAPPDVVLAKNRDNLDELLAEAHAIVIGGRAKLPPQASRAFEPAIRYKSFRVLLRKRAE